MRLRHVWHNSGWWFCFPEERDLRIGSQMVDREQEIDRQIMEGRLKESEIANLDTGNQAVLKPLLNSCLAST
jgi:hypothetical protein